MATHTKQSLYWLNVYNSRAHVHDYIIGFNDKDTGYTTACFTTSAMLPYITTLDDEDGTPAIKFRYGKKRARMLKASALQVVQLMPIKEFEKRVNRKADLNRGNLFELILCEHYGMTWRKNNKSYQEAPDLTINGIGYQCKFDGGVFIKENQV